MADYKLRTYRLYLDDEPTETKVMCTIREIEIINKSFVDDPPDAFKREYKLDE